MARKKLTVLSEERASLIKEKFEARAAKEKEEKKSTQAPPRPSLEEKKKPKRKEEEDISLEKEKISVLEKLFFYLEKEAAILSSRVFD